MVPTHGKRSIATIILLLLLCSCSSEPSGVVGRSLEQPPPRHFPRHVGNSEWAGLGSPTVITGWVEFSNTPSSWEIWRTVKGEAVILRATRRRREERYEGQTVGVYDIAVNRPLYFDGGSNLRFETGLDFGLGSGSNCIAYYQRFPGHLNRFTLGDEYEPRSPWITVEALDEDGHVLGIAKARRYLRWPPTGAPAGLEVEESHLTRSGSPYFKALSHYNRIGFKEYERTEFGKKRRELFPVWPMCPTGRADHAPRWKPE